MKPSKLVCHLNTKHPNVKTKPLEFFKRKLKGLNHQRTVVVQIVPLSDNTIQRRISDMAIDVRDQVIEKIKESTFVSLQFDESTDIVGCAQFVAFVRFESKERNTIL
ncbi:hypothetical protein RN001_003142 [Aquatica leii]|uniref:Zinc finger BED domain-containing protein 5 n=1 Tax=Aquatica leii TaxID=1421715 RepID=A0AAN7PNA2_9COLE|nr:hypothetical protein RN001_003142 [Aquatica leii]